MSPSPSLSDILGLEACNQVTSPTFQELLTRLWEARFQGAVTLHFAGGLPRSVVLSAAVVQIALDSRKDPSA